MRALSWNVWQRFSYAWVSLLLLACAPALPAPPPAPLTLSAPTSTPTTAPTAPPSRVIAPTAILETSVPTMVSSPRPQQTPNPVTQLSRALELADAEMRGAQTSATLTAAKQHAEATVNILVGHLGRWYGDQDSDGQVNDPSDQRGVLPGEIMTQAAPDTRAAVLPIGWALLVYDLAPDNQRAIREVILGEVELWRNNPRAGYDELARAIAATDLARAQLPKLAGAVPRAVAWARLILTRAQSRADAQTYAAQGILATSAARAAARTLAP